MKMKFFNYNLATSVKEGSGTWVKADGESATQNQLSVTLPEFRRYDHSSFVILALKVRRSKFCLARTKH